jgi:hypothetical protein
MRELTVELELSDVIAVGTTPPFSFIRRRFLRIDDNTRSYRFLFAVWHPSWRKTFINKILQISEFAILTVGEM